MQAGPGPGETESANPFLTQGTGQTIGGLVGMSVPLGPQYVVAEMSRPDWIGDLGQTTVTIDDIKVERPEWLPEVVGAFREGVTEIKTALEAMKKDQITSTADALERASDRTIIFLLLVVAAMCYLLPKAISWWRHRKDSK